MRTVQRCLNMGMGLQSKTVANTIIHRVRNGISILSGLQQPSHCESEMHAKMDKLERHKLRTEIEDVIMDVAAAFGYNIVLTGMEDE